MNSLTSRLAMSSSIDEQIEICKTQMLMDSQQRSNIETEITNDLKPIILKCFGSFNMYTFGSMQNGLALKGGDIDISVEVGSGRRSIVSQYENGVRVNTVAKALQLDRKFRSIEPVPRAKVPIVTMVHVPTTTKCDVSFNTSLNIEHGHLLQFYLNLHPRFFDVMLVIKMWAKKNGICNGRLYISSFAWNLLFINYLQSLRRSDGTKIVPSVLEMQADRGLVREIKGCRVDFNPTVRHVKLPEESKFSHLGLLRGFFAFYKKFSFKDNIVCPYLGIPVSRSGSSSESSAEIAQHMSTLRAYAKMGCGYRHLRIIQDPFDHKDFLVCRSENFCGVTSRIGKFADLLDMHQDDSRFLVTLFA